MAELFLVPTTPKRPGPTQESPADAAGRLAALDPRRSFLVEAPAGSGKTALLIQRFLILLAQPEVEEPSQVLAITFTRDATAELRGRVLAQLREAAAGTEPADSLRRQLRPLAEAVLERDRHLGWRLLDDPRRLNIQTIDAVCAEIARSLPVLSGAGGTLRPLEDPAPLYAEAARRTLARLGGPDTQLSGALRTVLLHRDADLGNTESLLAGMLAVRDQWAALVPLRPEDLTAEALDREVLPVQQLALRIAVEGVLDRLVDAMSAALLDELCRFAAETAHLPGYNGAKSPLAVCAGRHGPPGKAAEHLQHWKSMIHLLLVAGGTWRSPKGLTSKFLNFELTGQAKVQLLAFLDALRGDETLRQAMLAVRDLPSAEYPADQWIVTRDLLLVLSHALTELQMVFAERAACDFTELSLLARTALGCEEAVEDLAALAGGRLQHLLVDEMQDTSSGQYQLLHLLTRTWDGHSQTVFLVGDPKQSIYLFREARVERFLDTMRRGHLGELPLEVLHLTANFRSQRHLVEAFNSDFAAVFAPGTEAAGTAGIEYRAASATQPATLENPLHWHATLLPDDDSKAEQKLADAREIRSIIERWRAAPLPPGRAEPWRIAVLVRSRGHLLPVVEMLRGGPVPVPYRAVDIDALGDQPEILDLLALTRALLHPGDRTAWLALLRSPLCGLSLHALHTLSGADDDTLRHTPLPSLLPARIALLDAEDRAAAARFYRVLQTALRQRGTLRLSEWVHRTWLTFGMNRFLPQDRLGNAERYLELLDALEAGTGGGEPLDIPLLTARLEHLFSNASGAADAVDLMTIHGAKGLEWDVVLVPSLELRGRSNDARLLAWLEVEGSAGGEDSPLGLLAPIHARGWDAEELGQWMNSVRRKRDQAELKRLFYVACTRARQELHLFAAAKRNKAGELCADAGSLLRAALPAAAPHFVSAPAAGVLPFPSPAQERNGAEAGWLDRVAAGAGPTLFRLPVESTLPLPGPLEPAPAILRPRSAAGSFSSQAVGNVVHEMLNLLTREMAAGRSAEDLLGEIPAYERRIRALLRAEGLSGPECHERLPRVLALLRNTLNDPAGRWVLAPHPQAASEQELAAGGRVLRPDRTFLAGSGPLSTGTTHRWVVDYKTAAPGPEDMQQFLAAERERHTPQLQRYADALAEGEPVRMALFYPALPALLLL